MTGVRHILKLNVKSPQLNSPLMRYGFAVFFAFAALLVTLALWSVTSKTPYIFFLTAIVISARYGGFRSGIVTSILSVFLADFFILEPLFAVLTTPADIIHFAIIIVISYFLSTIEDNRLQSEKSLAELRDELDIILQSADDGITAQLPDGRLVFANAAAAKLSGYATPELMRDAPLSDFARKFVMFDEQGTPLPFSALPRFQVMETGKTQGITLKSRVIDTGEERWITLKSSPVLDEHGKIRLIVNLMHDITHNKQLEIMRRDSEERLRKVLDNLAAFVVVLHPNGRVIEANQAALRAANLKLEDVVGKPFDETYWWAYSKDVQSQLRTAIQNAAHGKEVRQDMVAQVGAEKFITMDFLFAPTSHKDDGIEYLVASGADVTERKQHDQEVLTLTTFIEGQRQRLNRIIANLPGIIHESSAKLGEPLKTNYISPYVSTMLGYSSKNWEDNPDFWNEIIHPEDQASVLRSMTEILESGQPGVVAFRCYAHDRREVYLEAHTSVLLDISTNTVNTFGVMMNITERQLAEDAITQYTRDLRRSNRELEQFIYIASHDLQEPLRMVTSYLDLVKQRYGDRLDKDGHEFIHFATDGAARMKQLINDLLTYSRIKRIPHEMILVNLEEIVARVKQNLQLLIEDTGAVITYDALPEVTANPGQMIQLFQNLLTNALKFRTDQPPCVHINATEITSGWKFAVQDNGIGIAQEHHERIFEIFQRLHTRDQYPGTGIGLAICRKIVNKHGGDIHVESQYGTGSTFYFTISSRP